MYFIKPLNYMRLRKICGSVSGQSRVKLCHYDFNNSSLFHNCWRTNHLLQLFIIYWDDCFGLTWIYRIISCSRNLHQKISPNIFWKLISILSWNKFHFSDFNHYKMMRLLFIHTLRNNSMIYEALQFMFMEKII
jgi:hypothetical protein